MEWTPHGRWMSKIQLRFLPHKHFENRLGPHKQAALQQQRIFALSMSTYAFLQLRAIKQRK
jgi:hypothetical protein